MYQVVEKEGVFHILEENEPVFTPAGNPVTANHETLARRLAGHLHQFGAGTGSHHSIAMYHFPMLDFVVNYPRSDIERTLILAFDPYNDWTFRCTAFTDSMRKRWLKVFGNPETRITEGRAWIADLNLNQLCAAMVLGKALGSMNIPLHASRLAQKSRLLAFAREIVMFKPDLGKLPLEDMLSNFHFYWEL